MRLFVDYSGKEVRLTEERLTHIWDHPEMTDMLVALEETLHKPTRVIQSSSDKNVALNYRFYFGTKVGDKWLCVVVKYIDNDAFVVTAYFFDQIKKGKQLWPNP